MEKFKKYGSPFVLPILFYVLAVVGAIVASLLIDGYGALAFITIFVWLWVFLVIPVYCVKYGKWLEGEKLKYLFATLQPLVLFLLHTLPFLSEATSRPDIFIAIFLWMASWMVIPLVLRQMARRRPYDPATCFANALLQNNVRRWSALVFTLPYALVLLSEPYVWVLYDVDSVLYYTVPCVSVVLILVFLLFKNKQYLLKRQMLSIAFAGECISHVFALWQGLRYMHLVNILLGCLRCVLVLAMFVGTLCNFKYRPLLKYGALGCAALCVLMVVFGLLRIGDDSCYHLIENGTYTVNPDAVIQRVSLVLYYAGIFILTSQKRSVVMTAKEGTHAEVPDDSAMPQ